MGMNKTITVSECASCPFEHRYPGPPARSCGHPDAPPGPTYENVIDVKHGRMPWCPLEETPVLVRVGRAVDLVDVEGKVKELVVGRTVPKDGEDREYLRDRHNYDAEIERRTEVLSTDNLDRIKRTLGPGSAPAHPRMADFLRAHPPCACEEPDTVLLWCRSCERALPGARPVHELVVEWAASNPPAPVQGPMKRAFSNHDAWYSDKTSQQVLDNADVGAVIEDHGDHMYVLARENPGSTRLR